MADATRRLCKGLGATSSACPKADAAHVSDRLDRAGIVGRLLQRYRSPATVARAAPGTRAAADAITAAAERLRLTYALCASGKTQSPYTENFGEAIRVSFRPRVPRVLRESASSIAWTRAAYSNEAQPLVAQWVLMGTARTGHQCVRQ